MKKVLVAVALLVGLVCSIWGMSGIEKARCDDCAPKACNDDESCSGENCYCDTDSYQCVSF